MDFCQKENDNDKIFEFNGIKVFIDPKSYLYLNGLTLDYSTELMNGGFKFLNPGSIACSCGSSFRK
jgi:iron-sulfur cluster assembly protein